MALLLLAIHRLRDLGDLRRARRARRCRPCSIEIQRIFERTSRSRAASRIRIGIARRTATIAATRSSARRLTDEHEMLAMIVVSLLTQIRPHAEELLSFSRQLALRRPVSYTTNSVLRPAVASVAVGMRCRQTMEKHALSVHETGHEPTPDRLDQSFLLIVRTRHIVTVPPA